MAQTTKLFDGKTTTGWHSYLKTGPGAWKVVDGALQLDPKAEGQGDLVTDKEYENYELSVTWKIAEGGNSGIIFGIHEDPSFNETYLTGIEMQVLDDKKASDNKKANHLAGSLYDLITPKNKVLKPVGEFNTARLLVDHGHVEQWVNGVKVVEYELNSKEINDLISKSKYRTNPNFAKSTSGHIMFQHHGQKVWLRNIKIKRL